MLPNTVAIPKLITASTPDDVLVILFVGNMGYYPNQDAVAFLNQQIVQSYENGSRSSPAWMSNGSPRATTTSPASTVGT